ncbi:hypothetical protein D8X55_00285 [Malacoplasma penetrans]|uniref:ATP synthase epsilon chain n=1 Tax=Malacoplasma penetrans (strain HF-2) TaxID=272633 RepID=Q8EWY7_MALP2|nr:ATP synthase subunit epsilon [Malacoplasma penetrans]RXY97357.1 hypothetical protein D8X55_00285 [Malacoplasma penetrans]BAC43853.1 ATP synthase subunit epsilon [Malacoplasma penetrans HF-2]
MGANSNLKLNIITPSKVAYSDFVKSVYFSDDEGDIVILNNYEPTIGKLKRSIIQIIDINNQTFEYIVDNGIYSVANCELNFLTSFCIKNTEEDKMQISQMREKTLNVLNSKNLNNFHFQFEVSLFKKISGIRKKN